MLHRCFEVGEDIKSISEEYGYGRNSIYQWRRQYLSGGAAALMSKKKHLPRGKLEFEEQQKTDEEVANMASRIKDDSPYFDLFTNELSLIS
ncbi:MAG: helix-turn-helix domain-containing protein [Erysipelotrichaceae bacterium]|nr:helix-turn-helix domain-containing protein [Erysipelotrichaceae bacterium]MBR2546222.1 helix-turn-helix domain-containing protein [Erysipelotrichaceae bacterium]